MEGDTPVKTGQNRQCIDNVRDYDKEHDRILNSVCHRLDLGPNMLPGAQQHTTVESAAALRIQDKTKGKHDENIYSANGQYRHELYKRAESMVPQLDGTYNVSDDSDTDSHSYLDLASSNIIVHRMRGQKQRYEINTRANPSRRLALKEGMKPNTNIRTQRQKVPDDEDIDINKIAQGDRPKDDRNNAHITAKQYQEKEAKRLALEKTKKYKGKTIQKTLCQRDEERERNITKRVQEFEKTFDFVNSHLLKGVATMAELTKSDNRQPMGKIKPTDKMVMMPSLFDGTKPATSKQHYERFNLYINFQTSSNTC